MLCPFAPFCSLSTLKPLLTLVVLALPVESPVFVPVLPCNGVSMLLTVLCLVPMVVHMLVVVHVLVVVDVLPRLLVSVLVLVVVPLLVLVRVVVHAPHCALP